MGEFFGAEQRRLQQQFGSTALADRVSSVTVHNELNDDERAFIGSRDLFFLSTIDHRGQPTCSYKGGAPGFVRILDGRTIAFPSYDGNGMYLSMGNIADNGKVGLLFIDFAAPNRLRLHGRATIDPADPLRAEYPGADLVVRVAIDELFVNCPRYIHGYQKTADSKYVPKANCEAPLAQWKRIDLFVDTLKPAEAAAVTAAGGPITWADYVGLAQAGQG